MRVLQLSWEYPPAIVGGLGRHVAALSAALAGQGIGVDVVTRGAGDTRACEPGGVRVHRVAQPGFPGELDAFLRWVGELNAGLAARAGELTRRHRFDLVHSHDWLVADAARTTARAAGLPWIATVHATEHGRHAGRVGRHPQSTIHAAERAMAADADHLITCSRYMAGHVGDVLGVAPARITGLRNGIDVSALRADPGAVATVRAQVTPGGERLVLLAGRLVHEKGFDVALRALAPILAARDDVCVAVAGTGPAETELRAQAPARGVRFLGWVDDATLHALYALAEVCLLPSRYEPFGIVALEAMAAGCPCIVADTGGLRELMGDGETVGLRVPVDDAGALRAAIVRMLDDDALRSRCRAGGPALARAHDWPAVAAATIRVYARVRARAAPVD